MIEKSFGTMVYLALGATDMRKSINCLSLLVEEQFELDLFSGSLFAFCNRKRDSQDPLLGGKWLLRLDEASRGR
jgi:transposase